MFLQTETDDVPTALMAFQGRLCAGVGKALRLYDIGKKKLLRKVEVKVSIYYSIMTSVCLALLLDLWPCDSYVEHARFTYYCR